MSDYLLLLGRALQLVSAGLIGTLNQIDQFENVHMAVADLGPKFFQFQAVFGCTVFICSVYLLLSGGAWRATIRLWFVL